MGKENDSTEKYMLIIKDKLKFNYDRFRGFAKAFSKNKIGLVGLSLLVFFIFIAIFAPFLVTNDPSKYNRVAAPFSQPEWMKPFDPDAFENMPSALVNPSFENDSSTWEFSAQGPNSDFFSSGWMNDTEHPNMEDPKLTRSDTGAFYVMYNDSDPNRRGSSLDECWLTTSIDWETPKKPEQIYIYVNIRVEIEGNLTSTGFKFEMFTRGALSENVSISRFYTPYYSEVYVQRRLYMNWGHINDGFTTTETDNDVNFMFRLGNVFNSNYNYTGSIKIILDDVRIQIRDEYWGLLGSSDTGADVFSQLLYGARASLIIGLTATGISVSVGVLVGMVAGYFGGKIDELLMRVVDFLLVIPRLPMLMVLAMVLGSSITNIILILGLLGWDGTARLIRSQVLSERNKAYVDSARAVGASDTYIIFRHILPNVTPLLFVQITLGVVGAILSEAGLSFLGLGDPASASWGIMLQDAFYRGALLNNAWWFVIPPGLGILFLSLGFTFVGYALDTILNPRLRSR
ncbi:MAG: ABC transporter permease [Candidatus Ranarchaeia archaeon]